MKELIKNQFKIDWVLIGTLILLIIGYIFLHDILGGTLLEPNVYDSYTLQALAWKDGNTALSQNYTHLELAIYNGNYYVSFPPFPSVIMYPFTFIFGDKVPSNFIIMIYVLASVVFAYLSIKKTDVKDIYAMFWSVFMVIGTNMLWMSTMGGVWFQAQALNILLCFAAIFSLLYNKKHLCMILLACAIGCRPFSVCLLAALYLYICDISSPKNFFKSLLKNTKYLIGPAIIVVCYMAYNYARFDNPFEFGHNYLPEFTGEGNSQFGMGYFLENIKNILFNPITILPNGQLDFSIFNGFIFYIANPIFIIWIIYIIKDIIKKRMSLQKTILCFACIVNLIMLLVHKTFGGWQFGARYTVDLIPFLLMYFLIYKVRKPNKFEMFLGGFAIMLNLYGTLAMTYKYVL